MNKIQLIIVAILMLSANTALAFSPSLDDMYREMLEEERGGKLPLYMSSKTSTKVVKTKKAISVSTKSEKRRTNIANVTNKQALEFSRPKPIRTWNDIVTAVQKGKASPFDLAKIKELAAEKNHDALELLAWMNANGVSMKQNLHNAWALYSQAAQLGVPKAIKNANAVYRAMSDYQRTTLPPY